MGTTDPELRMLLKRQTQQFSDLHLLLSNGFTSVVAELGEVKKEISSLKTDLVGPATGRDQVPLETHKAVVRNLSIAFGAAITLLTGIKLLGLG